MRILLDYRPALRARTGVGHYVHEVATALQPLLGSGESLVLFSSSWKDRLPSGAIAGAAAIDARIPVRALNFAWHRLAWPPVERFAGPVDIAQSAHPLLMPARRAAQAVIIYDLDFLDHPERTRAEIRRDYPALARRHAGRASLVVVISEYTARLVRERLGVPDGRIVICRPGAPGWQPREAGAPPSNAILFVGTIEPRKNLPVLFAAYARVLAARPGSPPLVLAGGLVEQSRAILEHVERYPLLKGRVRTLGYVTDAERRRLYAEAAMLVVPSLDEGFGMTALEALHSGVPVIASNRGALPEVVGDAGLLFDPADEQALAGAIGTLLADPAARHRLGDAGRARARQFSWHSSAAALLDAYREVHARHRSGRR